MDDKSSPSSSPPDNVALDPDTTFTAFNQSLGAQNGQNDQALPKLEKGEDSLQSVKYDSSNSSCSDSVHVHEEVADKVTQTDDANEKEDKTTMDSTHKQAENNPPENDVQEESFMSPCVKEGPASLESDDPAQEVQDEQQLESGSSSSSSRSRSSSTPSLPGWLPSLQGQLYRVHSPNAEGFINAGIHKSLVVVPKERIMDIHPFALCISLSFSLSLFPFLLLVFLS